MAILAELVDLVIGVDTHKHTHTAAVVVATTGATSTRQRCRPPGRLSATAPVGEPAARRADVGGREHWRLRCRPDPVPPCSSSAGCRAGPAQAGSPPPRGQVRPLDATRAAREALGRDQLAQPRAGGQQAALSVRLAARRSAVQATTDAQRQLHALVVAAPETLRGRVDHPSAGAHLCAAAPAERLGQRSPPPLRPAPAGWPAASSS